MAINYELERTRLQIARIQLEQIKLDMVKMQMKMHEELKDHLKQQAYIKHSMQAFPANQARFMEAEGVTHFARIREVRPKNT